MDLSAIQIISTRLSAFRDVLRNAPEKAKNERISIALARDFNAIRLQLIAEMPEFANHFPSEIEAMRFIPDKAENTYIELEIYVAQLERLIGLHNSGK